MKGSGETPLMTQYREIKARHPDAILFFRMGDFYEMFYEDAEIAARVLGLTLTSRNNGGAAEVPLAGIPVKAANEYLRRFVAQGGRCPRKFLITHEARLVEPLTPTALDNINSAQEYWRAMETLSPDTLNAPRTVTVQYFALLREQAGCSAETVRRTARTPAELYAELASRHPFTLPKDMLKVAINAEFGDWMQPLADGDTVVFIPPVAGG